MSRTRTAIACVGVYAVLASAIFYWHFRQEVAFGNILTEQRFYEGSVKDGEFWYRVRLASGNPLSPTYTTRLKKLNLNSGVETDTDFTFDESYVLPLWLGDTQYIYSSTAIYEVVGNATKKFEPTPFSRCVSLPFLYEGHLTVACTLRRFQQTINDESVWLVHWIDGHWVEGRQILLPECDRCWIDDPEKGEKVVSPRTSARPYDSTSAGTVYFFPYQLLVIPYREQMHVFATAIGGGFTARRDGFDFIHESAEVPSALAPENAPQEISGWRPVVAHREDDDWVQMTLDQHGFLFAASDTNNSVARFARQGLDGNSYELPGPTHKPEERAAWIAVDSSDKTTYVIHSNPTWGSVTICRLVGDTFKPPHLIVPGFRDGYIARWQVVCLRVASVWLLPILFLLGAMQWVAQGAATDPHGAELQSIELASPLRRAMGAATDAAILLGTSWLLWRFYLWKWNLAWPNREKDLANTLMDLEWVILSGNLQSLFEILRDSQLDWLLLPFEIRSNFFGIFAAAVIPICLLKIYVEGQWGLTPGKWLFGTRTVCTSRRPCGFARSLVRNLMWWIDFPLLITPIPAAISMMISDKVQRIGDRLADTIVVRK